jgi:hypothetical protein
VDGNGDYKAGDHCQFCKAKAECRERAKANMELAVYDYIEPSLLKNDEIAASLASRRTDSGASDIKDYAYRSPQGVRFDGWKVVEGRSNRKYTERYALSQKPSSKSA